MGKWNDSNVRVCPSVEAVWLGFFLCFNLKNVEVPFSKNDKMKISHTLTLPLTELPEPPAGLSYGSSHLLCSGLRNNRDKIYIHSNERKKIH